MDWSSPLSTLLGALIGVSSTLAVDRVRADRERLDKDKAVKRQVYADYLAALTRTRNELRSAARDPEAAPEDCRRTAVEALRDGGAYELRYQVAVLAPTAVDQASVDAFHALRDMHDLVEEGAVHTDPDYREAHRRWDERFTSLRELVRKDLGAVDDIG